MFDVSRILAGVFCAWLATAHADTPSASEKLEATYGLSRSNQSLLHGVLINYKNDPTLNVAYENTQGFASIQNGVGLWLVHDSAVKSGVSVNYMMGRQASADRRYVGMGNVTGAAMTYLWGEWQPIQDAITLYANYGNSWRDSHDALSQWGATLGLPVIDKVSVFVDVSRSWASQSYRQKYYGVNSQQASQSGYSAFAFSTSGVLYSNRQFGLFFELDKSRDLVVAYGKSSASGQLMNSPLLDRKTQALSTLVLTQRFDPR